MKRSLEKLKESRGVQYLSMKWGLSAIQPPYEAHSRMRAQKKALSQLMHSVWPGRYEQTRARERMRA